MRDTLVIVNEVGDIGVDHHLVRTLDDSLILRDTACTGCDLGANFARTLRDLFMLALQRRIRPFKRVLVETSGLSNPAVIPFLLRRDPFLAERYAYESTIAIADARRIEAQLDQYLEAAQQVALADLLLLSKIQDLDEPQRRRAARMLACLQPGVEVHSTDGASNLTSLLLGPRMRPRGHGSRLNVANAPCAASIHDRIATFSLQFPKPLRRKAFLCGMVQLQDRYGDALLRVKGWVNLEGEALPCVVQGIHQQLYPLTTLPTWPEDEPPHTRLVFIAQGADKTALEAAARERLREAIVKGP